MSWRGNLRFIAKIARNRLTLGITLGLLLLVQVAVPPNLTVPRAYINSQSVGLKSRDGLKPQLANESKTIKIDIGGSATKTVKSADIGLYSNAEATANKLPVITVKDRLIPFVPHYKIVKKHTIKPVVRTDPDKLRQFAAVLSQQYTKQPVNAQAQVKNGSVKIIPAEAGQIYTAKKIASTLEHSNPFDDKPIEIVPATKAAKVQADDLKHLQREYAKKTAKPLSVKYENTTKVVEAKQLKDWFRVAEDPVTNKSSLVLNDTVVDGFIQSWGKEYNIASGITQITYYDDIETSRRTGASGRALDSAAIKNQFNAWFNAPKAEPVQLATMVVPPRIVATRTYSRSSAQLQAKLNAWIASHYGNYQVAIRELGGRGREASYNVAQQTVMASTYKTFLAFVAYRQAENGALDIGSWEGCIDVMIVRSDNDCATRLGRHIGWAKVDQIIAAAGFQGVVLNNYDSNGNIRGDKLVNAREQAKFLAQLSAGALINPTNTSKLINYMKRQTYRAGIPAGSRGAPVADKVGFLSNYLHDVGIVYGSKSTYALVIMSQGSSWASIRNLSEAVYDFMNE